MFHLFLIKASLNCEDQILKMFLLPLSSHGRIISINYIIIDLNFNTGYPFQKIITG